MNVADGHIPHRRTHRPMPQKLLDGNKIHSSLVVVGRAGPPQGMRAEPLGHRAALQLHQIPQPVADRSPVQRTTGLVGEQHRRVRELRTNIGEPAQHQVQPVDHRHPPRPRPRRMRCLAEPHMQLAERTPPEMNVGDLQQCSLLRPQPAVIQRPEQGVIACRRRVFPGCRDPGLHELEEVRHPLRCRRR